jgi:hypothetical protein
VLELVTQTDDRRKRHGDIGQAVPGKPEFGTRFAPIERQFLRSCSSEEMPGPPEWEDQEDGEGAVDDGIAKHPSRRGSQGHEAGGRDAALERIGSQIQVNRLVVGKTVAHTPILVESLSHRVTRHGYTAEGGVVVRE